MARWLQVLVWPALLLCGGGFAHAQEASPALTRDQLDLIAQASLHPEEITLTESVTFTQTRTSGSQIKFQLPAGNQVRLVSVSPGQAELMAASARTVVPLSATDFFERVGKRREEAHKARMAAAGTAHDNIPQPHVRANMEQLLNDDMTRTRVELALDAHIWPPDRLATRHLALQVLTFFGLQELNVEADTEERLLVTGRTATGFVLELQWTSLLPRNQFFVRAPQSKERQLARGFSYEIPAEQPLLRTVAPREKPQDPDAPPKLLTIKRHLSPGQPLPLDPDRLDEYRQRFYRGEMGAKLTKRLLTMFETSHARASREELEELVDWLDPNEKSYRDEESGLTATLYFNKPYLFITLKEEENRYEFVVYPQGFWQSEPIRFMFPHGWFLTPAPAGEESPQEPATVPQP